MIEGRKGLDSAVCRFIVVVIKSIFSSTAYLRLYVKCNIPSIYITGL